MVEAGGGTNPWERSASQIPSNLPIRSPELIDHAVGSNVGDLARPANAIDANLETLPEGFLPLRELYADLEQAHVPLLDGIRCPGIRSPRRIASQYPS